LILLSPYPFQENNEFSYEFTTDQGIKYLIYFLDYSILFDAIPYNASKVYMFNIEIIEGNADNSIADERIGATIFEVFNILFANTQNVAIYLCDSTDNRQLARKRKFDFWFWKFNDGSIIKEDSVAIIENNYFYNSILLHKQNKHLNEIISGYRELNEKILDK
jgi:hypothetical protein